MTELIERWSDDPEDLADALVVLDFVSLEHGAADLRAALRTLDDHGPLALEAFRLQGLDGFALVSLYGPVLDALGDALPLDQALILLRVNADYVDELLRTHRPRRWPATCGTSRRPAWSRPSAAARTPCGWSSSTASGASAPWRRPGPTRPTWSTTTTPTPPSATRPSRPWPSTARWPWRCSTSTPPTPTSARSSGPTAPAVIPPIARTDAGPETLAYLRSKPKRSFTESLAKSVLFLSGENGQATIRTIKDDGLERVAALNSTELEFYQFLPLYDLLHLGNVLCRGYAPTSGEMTWALVDGCFVVADALSLAAIQPEGVAAAEAARAEVKAATREAAKAVGRELVEEGTEAARRALARRGRAGGRGDGRAAVALVDRPARRRDLPGPPPPPRGPAPPGRRRGRRPRPPLCAKAGIRLSTWGPLRFLKDGQEVLLRIPPSAA